MSFSLNGGECGFLVGASGSGKTTLMNIIHRQVKQDSGTVYIGRGRRSADSLSLLQVRRITGFIFQDFKLINGLSSKENVAIPLEIVGINPIRANRLAVDALYRVGLSGRINTPVEELSGGEAQRVAIARAIVKNPLVVLADEPTGNLDKIAGREILDMLVHEGKSRNIPVLIATHARDMILKYNAKVFTIKDRSVVQSS